MRGALRFESTRERKKFPHVSPELEDSNSNNSGTFHHNNINETELSGMISSSSAASIGSPSAIPTHPTPPPRSRSHKNSIVISMETSGSGSKTFVRGPASHHHHQNWMFKLARRCIMPLVMVSSMKLLVLIILSLQNSLFVVLRRYSQGVLKEKYSKYEVLLVGEIIKLLVSAYMIHRALREAATSPSTTSTTAAATTAAATTTVSMGGTSPPVTSNTAASSVSTGVPFASSEDDVFLQQHQQQRPNHGTAQLLERLRFVMQHAWKMIGLALIYGAMNILSFVALRNIGAGLFTIISQCKILTTAVFSAILLRRQYSGTQWRALVALLLGVLLFSEPILNSRSSSLLVSDITAAKEANVLLGVAAVATEVTLSGFASIYFEKVIKTDPIPMTIWERNFQLAMGSIPVYLAFMACSRGGTAGYFGGWSIVAWIVALLGAAGGLLVALSIKYGDAILKTLATTASIILSSLLDWWLLDGKITPIMVIAAVQVIISICNYTFDPTPPEQLTTAPLERKRELSKYSDRPARTAHDSTQSISTDDLDDVDNYDEGIPLMDQNRRPET